MFMIFFTLCPTSCQENSENDEFKNKDSITELDNRIKKSKKELKIFFKN